MKVGFPAANGKVKIRIRFENENAAIFGWDLKDEIEGIPATAVYYAEGEHWVEGLSDMDIKIGKDSNYAKYATILNAVSDYHDFCNEYGIKAPEPLKILAVDSISSACAPLTTYTGTGALLAQLITDTAILPVGVPLGTSVATTLSAISPDIIIGTKTKDLTASGITGEEQTMTEAIYANVFHELSHASHYFGLGLNGGIVWNEEYVNILCGWDEVTDRGESIADNAYNNGGNDLVKLIESWGYFSENYVMTWKFRNKSIRRLENGEEIQDCSTDYPDVKTTSYTYTNKVVGYKELKILGIKIKIPVYEKDTQITRTHGVDGLAADYVEVAELSKLDNEGKSKKYFAYDGFWDLVDSNEYITNVNTLDKDLDNDFTKDFTYEQLFCALCLSGVKSLSSFAEKLVRITGRISDLEDVLETINENIQ